MTFRAFLIVVALAVLTSIVAAEAAVIDAVVVERSTGLPIARARISVQPLQTGSSPLPYFFTDSTGHFHLSQPGAGAFYLRAEKRGYAPVYYGQRKWNGPGTPIVLDKDSHFTAELSLSRLGAITGEIVDENGIGLPDVQVYAYRVERPPRLAGQGVSNDRGVFRIAGLQPGKYRVRTGPKELEDETGLMPTFFGNTVVAESASTVEVRLDEETGNVSIRPVPGKLLHLSGRVNLAGVPMVILYSDDGRKVETVDGSGRFTFNELSPGKVELIAESGSAGRGLTAYTSLWLSGNLDGVTLEPAPMPAIQFGCEDLKGKALDSRQISLTVVRTSPPQEPRSQQLPCGGTAAVSVGTWQLSIATPTKYYAAEVLVQRKPVESDELQMLPGQHFDITLVASSLPAGFKGTLLGPSGQPAAGAMVFLHAVDQSVARRAFGSGTTRTDPSGGFVFEGLPPGRYKVAASYDVQIPDEVDWSDPSLLTVELEEGKELSQEIPLRERN